MRANVCFMDLGGSNLSENALLQAIDLLRVCSHKLKVLILDGNTLSSRVLGKLYLTIKDLGLKQIVRLSMSRCGLACSCKDLR